jgi:hypothetical protein
MEDGEGARLAAVRSWSRFVMRELASIGQLASLETVRSEERPTQADVRAAAEPHLPILVHKRSKAHGPGTGEGSDPARWLAELDRLAKRWTHLSANDAERARLVEILDRVVQAEQLKQEADSAAMPMTSRFDTSWAI